MNCKSISSLNINPYEAGLEIGEALHDLQPEAIILLASIHYADFSELFDGLYDGLETRDVTIIGGTGAGIYETSQVGDVGVCALGFNSDGAVSWSLALEPDIMEDAFAAGQRCAQRMVEQAGDDLKFSFIFSGMGGNGNQLTAGIRSVTDTPCVGGLTGDGTLFHRGVVLVNGRLHENTVAMLGLSGNISFMVNLATGWCPVGYPGVVEKVNGTTIEQISGQPATEFINQQMSQQAPVEGALDFMTLAAYQENGNEDQFVIRAPYKTDEENGAVSYYGSVETGTPVRVCFATRDDVISGVDEAVGGLPQLDFQPAAGLVISCAVRKFILGNQAVDEVKRLAPILPESMPLVGMPTFGEIAPHPQQDGSYTGTYFHNVTYVIAVFGVAKQPQMD